MSLPEPPRRSPWPQPQCAKHQPGSSKKFSLYIVFVWRMLVLWRLWECDCVCLYHKGRSFHLWVYFSIFMTFFTTSRWAVAQKWRVYVHSLNKSNSLILLIIWLTDRESGCSSLLIFKQLIRQELWRFLYIRHEVVERAAMLIWYSHLKARKRMLWHAAHTCLYTWYPRLKSAIWHMIK